MEKPRTLLERREAILRAEGEKKSTILVAEGNKESAILDAEAEKQAAILRADTAYSVLLIFMLISLVKLNKKILLSIYLVDSVLT